MGLTAAPEPGATEAEEVKREQAMAVLEIAAKEVLPACAHPAR